MDLGLKNKRAVICGGSKGLGLASAEALAQEGASLFLVSREEGALKSAAENLRSMGSPDVQWATCDLTSHESRQQCVDKILEAWIGADILVHNVGGPKASFVMDTKEEQWHEGFDRLFIPVVHFNSAFIPYMKKAQWGRIITITSLSVIEPIPMLAISNALRSASTSLSKSLSDEIAKFGITVNCVAPGMVQTDRTEDLLNTRISNSGQSRDDYMAEMLKTIPAGRLGSPKEFGDVVCFLCSDQASYVTGSTICVDGGKRRSTY